MLIRSQDKQTLIPMENFIIHTYQNSCKKFIVSANSSIAKGVIMDLGEYESIERAISILDEIQLTYINSTHGSFNCENGWVETVVYEMPNE